MTKVFLGLHDEDGEISYPGYVATKIALYSENGKLLHTGPIEKHIILEFGVSAHFSVGTLRFINNFKLGKNPKLSNYITGE